MCNEDAFPPVVPVILCGGCGSRLWPLSRARHPKPFLPLLGDRSLVRETARRVAGPGFTAPLVVCHEDHRFLVAEHLRQEGIQPRAIILEPVGRDTAPAAAVAALHLAEQSHRDVLMLIMPSDHLIRDNAAFLAAIETGRPAAETGTLVTFGITPTAPETGYGYIQAGDPRPDASGVLTLTRFVEKPDSATATRFVADRSSFWNSGIFLVCARTYLRELDRAAPAILEASRAALAGAHAGIDFLRLDSGTFAAMPSASIDVVIMEHTARGAVVPVEMGWTDLGAWSTLWDIGAKDAAGNVTHGNVLAHEAHGSYLRADSGLLAVTGVDDLIVVVTDDAVLVADRTRAQSLRPLVTRVKTEGRPEYSHHTTVHRPWGSYRTVDRADRFQVKHMIVRPGAGLPLQMHHHRAEHWVVVRGTARVTRGQETFLLDENGSIRIPAGSPHRLDNPGKVPLHLIEVQSGTILAEDGIARVEDGQGRSEPTPDAKREV